MTRKRIVLIVLLSLVAAAVATAQNLTIMSLTPPSAETSALGGPHAALVDGLPTLYSNPAGFSEASPGIRFSELTLKLSGPIFDIAGVAAQGAGGGISKLLASPNVQKLLQSIYTSMDILGPISFGYVGKGLGFGIFNDTSLTLATTAPFTVTAALGEETMLNGGYAFRIPLPAAWHSRLDAGVELKGGLQGVSSIERSLIALPALVSSLGVGTLTGSPFYFNTVIGFDAGVRYSYRNWLSVGVVGRNIYTPVFQSYYPTLQGFLNSSTAPKKSITVLPFNLAAGALFTPKLSFLEPYLSHFKVMVDYSHALDLLLYPATAKNPLLNIGIGSQITLLRILDLRGGFYQGLFSAGLGVNLKYFRIDAAMFGTELSSQPGLDPTFNLIVGFTVTS